MIWVPLKNFKRLVLGHFQLYRVGTGAKRRVSSSSTHRYGSLGGQKHELNKKNNEKQFLVNKNLFFTPNRRATLYKEALRGLLLVCGGRVLVKINKNQRNNNEHHRKLTKINEQVFFCLPIFCSENEHRGTSWTR